VDHNVVQLVIYYTLALLYDNRLLVQSSRRAKAMVNMVVIAEIVGAIAIMVWIYMVIVLVMMILRV
jgi:hypothetical protein